jgi:hypothetical protein
MYLLPKCLQPADRLDTPDLRFLNSYHGIVTHPLQPPLDIKLCNEQWFEGHLSMVAPTFIPVSMPLIFEAEPPQWQQQQEEEKESQTEIMNEDESHLPGTAEELYEAIQVSNDKLFLIRYAAAGTFRPRWYLVRVASEQVRTAPSVECVMYTVEFLAKHVNDEYLSDPYA